MYRLARKRTAKNEWKKTRTAVTQFVVTLQRLRLGLSLEAAACGLAASLDLLSVFINGS